MGLLRLLGIEKYLKKVKTYVDEENVKDRAYTDKKVSENKAATPDWDAESWEAGYIKNRTHYSRNIILQSNESNGKYTYYLDFYESDDTTTAWLSFYDITENRTREISLSDLNGFVVDLGYARISFSLVLDQNEGAYYVAIESSTGNVDSRILDSVAIQTVEKTINQGYIPDSIARHFYIEELYEEVTALWGLTEWPTIDGTALMNSLDRGLTLDELMALGFPAKIREYPHDIKGILIEYPTSEGYRKQRLPLMYASENEHGVDCVSFGRISRAAFGSELDVSFENDGTCYLTYTEA